MIVSIDIPRERIVVSTRPAGSANIHHEMSLESAERVYAALGANIEVLKKIRAEKDSEAER